MSVRIQLSREYSHLTNLDIIEGRVILNLKSNEKVTGVVVKLEGESKTKLAGPKRNDDAQHDKERTELEFHKILYKVQEVFPGQQIKNAQGYSLPPGQHEWPFSFKLPFNNNCVANEKMYASLPILGGVNFQVQGLQTKHIKQSLPPSLNGFPGLAEIRYYLKVTVQRVGFLKENYRATKDFKFLPIEPPRPEPTKLETYARRQHQFTANLPPPNERKSSIFSIKRTPSQPVPPSPTSGDPPRFKVDARLPNPAILTCNETIPLRVLITKLSQAADTLYLLQFQIQLIGTTFVRAADLNREEKNVWIITSKSAINAPLGAPSDVAGTEIPIDPSFWKSIGLPNTVAPSFDACNIRRSYELEVRVGISYGKPGKGATPEQIILPLRIPVQIFSGIAPPAELLERMRNPSTLPSEPTNLNSPQPQTTSNLAPPSPISNMYPISAPHTPTFNSAGSQYPAASGYLGVPHGASAQANAAGPSSPSQTLYPPQLAPGQNPAWDVPPSYEDAIAGDIAPVDGPRREYGDAPPNLPARPAGQGGKDDRLFPS